VILYLQPKVVGHTEFCVAHRFAILPPEPVYPPDQLLMNTFISAPSGTVRINFQGTGVEVG
jgi:hypothetical protein